MTQQDENQSSRKFAKLSPPALVPRSELPGRVTDIRHYKLITPLFGGGAENHASDAITTIRATEIRGQLRFWWRACRASKYGTIEKMKAAEDAIWGTTAATEKNSTLSSATTVHPSPDQSVQFTIKIICEGKEEPSFIVKRDPNNSDKYKASINTITGMHPYAAFPLQPTKDDLKKNPPPDPPRVRMDVFFELTISYPKEHQKDIAAALWAWETFGGIGARTRRGFGALLPCDTNQTPASHLPASSKVEDVRMWLQKKLEEYVPEGKPPTGVPALSQELQFHITMATNKPVDAWKSLITKLSEFRQIPFGRIKRSHWPEAEAIRTLTKRRDPKYRARNHPLRFPRAVFGLPIVFHFKDKLDPLETTLQGAEESYERLASPLILRPLMCKNNQSVGLAVLLEGRQLPPGGLVLQKKQEGRSKPEKIPVQANLTPADLHNLPDLKLTQQTDILQSFMQFLGGK